jgi:hypothetical protein
MPLTLTRRPSGALDGGAGAGAEEVLMHAFIVELENRPGVLADVAQAIGDRGINIEAITGATCGSTGSVGFITDNHDGAREALDGGSFHYRELGLVTASLENRPGTLATAARRMADRGVNVELLMPTGMDGSRVNVAFAVSDPIAARLALAELAAPEG